MSPCGNGARIQKVPDPLSSEEETSAGRGSHLLRAEDTAKLRLTVLPAIRRKDGGSAQFGALGGGGVKRSKFGNR